MKSKIIALGMVMFIFVISCKKDENVEEHKLKKPDELVSVFYPQPDQSGVGLIPKIGVNFNYPLFLNETHIEEEDIKIVIDSATLFSEVKQKYGLESLKIGGLSCYFPQDDSLEPGTIYFFHLKVHAMVWDNSQWVPYTIEGEIEYHEYNFQFQTEIPYKVISNVYPEENSSSFSIYASPALYTKYPIDSMLTFAGFDQKFKIILKTMKLWHENNEISGSFKSDDTTAWLYLDEILPEGAQMKLEIEIQWQKLINDEWMNCIDLQNNAIEECIEVNFTTRGGTSTLICDDDIKASYPVNRQYHFLQDESDSGCIVFQYAMDHLFTGTLDGNPSKYWIVFSENKGNVSSSQEVVYNSKDKMFVFELPQNLKNETIYEYKLIGISQLEDTVTYKEMFFRTSRYNDFESKVNDLFEKGTSLLRILGTNQVAPNSETMHMVLEKARLSEEIECFDKAEAYTDVVSGAQSGLARIEALLEDNSYYQNYVYNKLYKSWDGELFKPEIHRDIYPYGIPPVHAAYIDQHEASYDDYAQLTDSQIQNNEAPQFLIDHTIAFIFCNQVIYKQDESDLYQQIIFFYSANDDLQLSERVLSFYNSSIPWILSGYYQYKIKYVLPTGKVTSEIPFTLGYFP
ncbi:MAG: hypothetical protein JXB49_22370 [Bacteroidales bacterium]|nr:hypothetical protein [Bacteroidales bacterium]